MDQTLKSFIDRARIAQIKTEADPVNRTLLATLLDEEKARQVSSDAIVDARPLVRWAWVPEFLWRGKNGGPVGSHRSFTRSEGDEGFYC